MRCHWEDLAEYGQSVGTSQFIAAVRDVLDSLFRATFIIGFSPLQLITEINKNACLPLFFPYQSVSVVNIQPCGLLISRTGCTPAWGGGCLLERAFLQGGHYLLRSLTGDEHFSVLLWSESSCTEEVGRRRYSLASRLTSFGSASSNGLLCLRSLIHQATSDQIAAQSCCKVSVRNCWTQWIWFIQLFWMGGERHVAYKEISTAIEWRVVKCRWKWLILKEKNVYMILCTGQIYRNLDGNKGD